MPRAFALMWPRASGWLCLAGLTMPLQTPINGAARLCRGSVLTRWLIQLLRRVLITGVAPSQTQARSPWVQHTRSVPVPSASYEVTGAVRAALRHFRWTTLGERCLFRTRFFFQQLLHYRTQAFNFFWAVEQTPVSWLERT